MSRRRIGKGDEGREGEGEGRRTDECCVKFFLGPGVAHMLLAAASGTSTQICNFRQAKPTTKMSITYFTKKRNDWR